jgi:Arc/MetJ-type ribon-helix-helix transcriptional regulator
MSYLLSKSGVVPIVERRGTRSTTRDAVRYGQRLVLGERGNETEALRVLGAVAAQRDAPDLTSAEEAYSQALTLADGLGRRST